jgi:uncharacterized protein (DUF885 family)
MSHDGECGPVKEALSIVDEAWREFRRSPYVQVQLGVGRPELPDISFSEAKRRSDKGSALLRSLDTVDEGRLPYDLILTLRLVRFCARTWAREAEWYWIVSDPLGVGFFGMFLPTAYCGGFLLNVIHESLNSVEFARAVDADNYLAFVRAYGEMIDQFTARTAGQVERRMWMPKVQVLEARVLLTALRARARHVLNVVSSRLRGCQSEDFIRELGNYISVFVETAFDRAVEGLSDCYLARAPEGVGLGQYTDGGDVYRELVKLHTTLDLSPEEVHRRGCEQMGSIEAAMRAVRSELDYSGDGAGFLAHISRNPRWRVDTVEGIAAMFQRYIDRLRPLFGEYFASGPQAACSVGPLPEALQAAMTYGYYEEPRTDRPEGRYLFNFANLSKQALITVGSLTYHELIPGHHLHLAGQQENPALHPLRKYGFVNAYAEGWAEYAATFAGEVGMYEEPEERYGRLIMDGFLTSRLVVDTGMNIMGWSLEKAQDYMRRHSGMAEVEILSESVRYSCDIPGQALAYKLGDKFILSLRERMRQALGVRFDLKTFHSAVLGPGALPLPDLEWHIGCEIERLSGSQKMNKA